MTSIPPPTPLPRALARWLALSIVLGAAIGGVFSAQRGTLTSFAIAWAISTLYAVATGLPIMLAFRRVRPRPPGRSELMQWARYAGIVLGFTVAGTLTASLILVPLGVASFDYLWAFYARALQIAFAITVPVSIGAVTFSRLRHRLVATEASLHAKEREHQRALALAAEARLASLESRVRPHFLFNALNSAIALIPDEPSRAEDVLARLAGLLRFSLDTAATTVSLGDELRVVVDYLEIERARFGDRLRYDIDVPDALRGAMIPAFAVQTVVENSVKYAVSVRKDGAQIRVRGRRGDGRLRLEISDDGPGFAGATWRPGHGLDALRARLDALYGPAARLVAPLAPAVGGDSAGAAGGGDGAGDAAAGGARVTIELPEVPA